MSLQLSDPPSFPCPLQSRLSETATSVRRFEGGKLWELSLFAHDSQLCLAVSGLWCAKFKLEARCCHGEICDRLLGKDEKTGL
jgi:hypothetical protein